MSEPIYTLITGASSGIGKAMAWHCGSLGMNLILVSLPDENLKEVAHQIAGKYNVKTAFFETNLSQPGSPQEVFNWTQLNGFDVNVLVNNAAATGASVFEKSDLQYIDDRIQVNIRALVMLTRLYLPVLKTHKTSFILNVASLAAFFPIPYKSLYSSSKLFVVNFSKSIRSELKGTGVNLSVLCPNGVNTNSTTYARVNSHGKLGRLTSLSAEEVARIGINGMLKQKFLIIPGSLNHLIFVLHKIIPGLVIQKILSREFMKEVQATCNYQ